MHPLMIVRRLTGPAVALVALSTGCFYGGSINERPRAEIELATTGTLRAFDVVELRAGNSSDPDGDAISYFWTARKCDPEGRCDLVFDEGTNSRFFIQLDSKEPVEVELIVTDELGAWARDTEPLQAENRAPDVSIQVSGLPAPETGDWTVGRELLITASGSDRDRDLDSLAFEWRLTPPKLSSPNELVFESAPAGDDESARRLVPDVVGNWSLEVTVSDGDGGSLTDDVLIPVVADAPPCLSLSEPEAIPDAPYVLLGDAGPRTFSVLRVVDELDPFPEPATPQADDVAVARFRWLLAGPDGNFDVVGEGADASFALDPADYAPGDVVDLRVEVLDRVERTLPCAEEQATCSIGDDPACLQRVTWKAEIR